MRFLFLRWHGREVEQGWGTENRIQQRHNFHFHADLQLRSEAGDTGSDDESDDD
jgi:hypothetical protein